MRAVVCVCARERVCVLCVCCPSPDPSCIARDVVGIVSVSVGKAVSSQRYYVVRVKG